MTAPGHRARAYELSHLQRIGDWGRLAERARSLLGDDPNDETAHFSAALANIHLEQLPAARQHIDALFAIDPEDSQHHRLIAIYYVCRNLATMAEAHVRYAIQIEPENDANHRLLAEILSALGKHREAREHIWIARRLDSEDPDTIASAVRIEWTADPKAARLDDRLAELQSALRISPEHAGLIHAAGRIYLDDVGDVEAAEDHFRRALILRPTDAEIRRDFFRLVLQRSFLYRLLDLPTAVFARREALGESLERNPALGILFIPLAPFAVLFALWLIASLALFALPARAYEWALVSELKRHARTTGTAPVPPLVAFLRRRQFAVRFGAVLFAIAVFYAAVLILAGESVFALSPFAAAAWIAGLTVLHTGLLIVFPSLSRKT